MLFCSESSFLLLLSYAVVLMRTQRVPVLSLSLHLLTNPVQMMLLCCLLVSALYLWIPNQLSTCSKLMHLYDNFIIFSTFNIRFSLKLQDGPTASRTLDLASTLEVGRGAAHPTGEADLNNYNRRSVLTIAFQFTFEIHFRDNVATMARQYVRNVVSSVQRVAMAIAPCPLNYNLGSKALPGFPESLTLARWLCRSYRYINSYILLIIGEKIYSLRPIMNVTLSFLIVPKQMSHF